MTTTQKNVKGQLAAARAAAERKRKAGESDAFEQGEISRLSAELDRVTKINEEVRPARRGRGFDRRAVLWGASVYDG